MGSVRGSLQFLKRLDLYQREVPFQIFMPIPDDAEDPRPDNLEFEAKEHLIEDIRDAHETFTLDNHGFEHLTCPPSWIPTSTSTRHDVEALYLPDVENLIKTHVDDVDEVFFFDWRLRDADRATTDVEVLDLNDPTARIRPATHVHIDQSPASVVHRTKLQLADHAEYLLQGRVRIINIWRPLDHTVLDYPLGVCDGRSVDDKDMLECDVVRRRFIGGTIYLCYNESQKWHYLSNQTCDEVLLLKMFDSESSVVRACPHASFLHPSATPDTPKRKSIEVRALVFTYPDRPDLETSAAHAM